jgi:hypothetical protein
MLVFHARISTWMRRTNVARIDWANTGSQYTTNVARIDWANTGSLH